MFTNYFSDLKPYQQIVFIIISNNLGSRFIALILKKICGHVYAPKITEICGQINCTFFFNSNKKYNLFILTNVFFCTILHQINVNNVSRLITRELLDYNYLYWPSLKS